MNSKLILKDGTEYKGKSFGAEKNISGEVVFCTGMVGYPESLTDPSFRGQILVFTYPLLGNYGVPDKKFWESGKIQTAGIIVCNYNETPSHYLSKQSLSDWLKKSGVPALEIKDTRGLTLKLRDKGVMLGKINFDTKTIQRASASEPEESLKSKRKGSFASALDGKDGFEDPNLRNLVAEVSTKKPYTIGSGKKTVALIDCGSKRNIAQSLVDRGLKVVVVPWDYDPLKLKNKLSGVVISNGPGDPTQVKQTILNVQKLFKKKMPILGICLGNQILALAAGGKTYKLKFGHRGQNQPCVLKGTKTCLLTTQNHGFAVGKIPSGFKEWFYNANDKTNEGIIHKTLPFMSVQFHPEATPGPTDADFVFDEFIKRL
jgi:carbamoyl-phosphate synthase small subunit